MPYARATLRGNQWAPNLAGTVTFYPWNLGTIVKAEVFNLPPTKAGTNEVAPIGPFGFHIHEGSSCDDENFEHAEGHFNPTNEPHPFHAGDLPSLLGNDGYAYMVIYTNRFRPNEIINKTAIIHLNPDDYRSQPAGASGPRMGCGVIQKI